MRMSTSSAAVLHPSRWRTRAEEIAREQSRSVRAWTRVIAPGALPRPPEFLIIGGMRCGTTSVFFHLAEHPEVHPALGKELNYFTLHHGNGLRWYRAHFPHRAEGHLSFEASPYYLYHPLAPGRVIQALPEAKLVVLVRNPVDRAYSHYLHTRRRGFEPLSFADALEAEPDRLSGAGSGGSQDPARLYSYISRGRYAEQLERWLAVFPRERLHVMRSEDLFSRPAAVLDELAHFLGITPLGGPLERHAVTPKETSPQLTPELRLELSERFAPHNERLADLLGWSSAWTDDLSTDHVIRPLKVEAPETFTA